MILVLYDVNDTNDVMGMDAVVVIEASVLPAVYRQIMPVTIASYIANYRQK